MSISFSLTKNTLAGKKGYIARTLYQPTLRKEDLISRMAGLNTTLSSPVIRGVLSLLEEVTLNALREGRRVEIGEMLQLSPAVTGVFAGKDMCRAENDPKVRIKPRVLPDFTRRFRLNVKLENKRGGTRDPRLESLIGADGEQNTLHRVYVNALKGTDLKVRNFSLTGLTLWAGPKEKLTVAVSALAIQRYTANLLTFHFAASFSPPAWLADGRSLKISLVYRHDKDGRTRSSYDLAAVWRDPVKEKE